jgi:hypothetical protein
MKRRRQARDAQRDSAEVRHVRVYGMWGVQGGGHCREVRRQCKACEGVSGRERGRERDGSRGGNGGDSRSLCIGGAGRLASPCVPVRKFALRRTCDPGLVRRSRWSRWRSPSEKEPKRFIWICARGGGGVRSGRCGEIEIRAK